MSRNKFVMSEKPSMHADRLHELQREMKKLEQKYEELEREAKQLTNYLVRYSKGESFLFNSADGYQKVLKISQHSRMILDQAKVKRLLKTRTPYTESNWTTVKVDWLYQPA